MRLLWAPPDAEPREFPWEPADTPPEDYEAVEDLGRWASFDDFVDAVRGSSRSAWRVLLWLLRRRDGEPDLLLADVRPAAGELGVRFNPDTELALAEAALASPSTPPDMREAIERELPTLRAAAGKVGPASGPGRSRTSGARAAGTSRTTSTSRRRSRTD